MKIYTIKSNGAVPGIKETQHERLGRVLVLGERGRGRWESLVTIHRDMPENFDAAYPIVREKEIGSRKVNFVLLVPERQPSQNVLLHICTAGPYTRNTKGWVRVVSGEAKLLAQGYGAHGDAGRLGTWDDDLWQVAPGAVLKVEYFGGHKVPLHAVVVDANGVPSVMLWDEYETVQAVNEMMDQEAN